MQINLNINNSFDGFLTSLGNFVFADYLTLIGVITLSLLLGIITYVKRFKTQIYLPIILALLSFLIIKGTQVLYYVKYDEKFLINIIIFLGVLFVLYMVFLATESKNMHVKFEISTLLLLAFFGILLILENSEGVIVFVGLEIQAFTYYTLVSMADKNILGAMASYLFILGAMASYLFILGLSVLYGVTVQKYVIEMEKMLKNTFKP